MISCIWYRILSDSENCCLLESTRLTWKGVPSAQVATQNACDLCVSAVCRESSCLNYYLHSQITEQIAFHGLVYLGALFSVLTPGVDEIGNDPSVRNESWTRRSVFHTCDGTDVDSQVTAVRGLSEVPEKKSDCLESMLP